MAVTAQNIPVVDLRDWHEGGAARAAFVRAVGESLAEIGFFAVTHHGVPDALTHARVRGVARVLPPARRRSRRATTTRRRRAQRGFTGFGTEHAKDSHGARPQGVLAGRPPRRARRSPACTGCSARTSGPPRCPTSRPTLVELYRHLDDLGGILLEACAAYLGEPAGRFRDMTHRQRHDRARPLLPAGRRATSRPAPCARAAHEDINLITLLSGATAEGLELLRRDGTWMPVHTGFDTIVVDAGDMLQNVTNGLYKSTTHRVVNPGDAASERFSMPCFIHARVDVDLSPLPIVRRAHRRHRDVPAHHRRRVPRAAAPGNRPRLARHNVRRATSTPTRPITGYPRAHAQPPPRRPVWPGLPARARAEPRGLRERPLAGRLVDQLPARDGEPHRGGPDVRARDLARRRRHLAAGCARTRSATAARTIRTTCSSSSGALFATTFDGLKVDARRLHVRPTPPGMTFVSTVAQGPDGALYYGAADGTTRRTPATPRSTSSDRRRRDVAGVVDARHHQRLVAVARGRAVGSEPAST